MPDLHDRFERLDAVAVPDLWTEIEQRADRLGTAPAARILRGPVRGRGFDERGAGRWASPVRRLPALVGIALLIAGLLGSLVAGMWVLRNADLLTSWFEEHPSAMLTTCPEPASMAAPDGPASGWTPGRAPGPRAEVAAGPLIVARRELAGPSAPPGQPWAQVDSRIVYDLLDPATRTLCRFLGGGPIEQGQLFEPPLRSNGNQMLSPGGEAWAVEQVVAESETVLAVRDIAGFQELAAFNKGFYGVSMAWSNDAQTVAYERGLAIVDWSEATPQVIWLQRSDGSAPREVTFAGCDPCVASPGPFAPDDRRLAATYWRIHDDGNGADRLLAVVDLATATGSVLDIGQVNVEVLGWRDAGTVVVVAGGQVLAVPIDDPTGATALGLAPADPEGRGAWSPDFTRFAYLAYVEGPEGHALADVHIADATGVDRVVARFTVCVCVQGPIWSPDSRQVAFYAYGEEDPSGVRPPDPARLMIVDALAGTARLLDIDAAPMAWIPAWR